MKIIALFNGIRFPFTMAEKAIQWAKDNKAEIAGLFLKSKDELKEGYVFPSDLDAAENLNDIQDTENSNVRVIRRNADLLKSMARTDGISCSTELLTDPSLEILMRHTADDTIIFADAAFDAVGPMTSTAFDLADLSNKAGNMLEIVADNRPRA